MRVVCDNCGASYKIPETKLVRDVNKATCRKCGHKIIIRRPSRSGAPIERTDDDSTHLTERPTNSGHDEVGATEMRSNHSSPHEATVPRGDLRAAAAASLMGQDSPTAPPPMAQPAIPAQATPAFGQGSAPFPPPQQPAYPPAAPPPPAAAPYPQQQPAPPPAYPQAQAYGAQPTPPAPAPQAAPPQVAPPPAAPPQPAYPPQGYPQAYDPSGDLTLVMMASLFAALGALLMAFGGDAQLGQLGLGLVLWSSLTSMLVLATGDRGRKEARAFLSMVLALILAVGVVVGTMNIGEADPGEAVATPEVPEQPEEATTPEEGAPDEEATPEEATPEEGEDAVADAEEGEDAKETPQPASASGSSSSSSSAPRSSGSSSSGSSGSSNTSSPRSSGSSSSSASSPRSSGSSSSSSSSAPPKEDPPAETKLTSVPPTVIDTMVKTNRDVLTCFKKYRDETGTLPSGRIPMKITILPSGKVSGAYIDGGAYAGGSLDSCLSTTIRSIRFPEFDGEARTYPYLFQF